MTFYRRQRRADREWIERFKDYPESDFPIEALIVACSVGGLVWIVVGLAAGWI